MTDRPYYEKKLQRSSVGASRKSIGSIDKGYEPGLKSQVQSARYHYKHGEVYESRVKKNVKKKKNQNRGAVKVIEPIRSNFEPDYVKNFNKALTGKRYINAVNLKKANKKYIDSKNFESSENWANFKKSNKFDNWGKDKLYPVKAKILSSQMSNRNLGS